MIPQNKRVSDEKLIAAYAATGNVWKAGERVGLCGQTAWARLKRLGIPMNRHDWTQLELERLRKTYADAGKHGSINLKILSTSLGRPRSSICKKARELGLGTTYGREKTPEQCTQISRRTQDWLKTHPHPRGAYKGRIIKICPECGRFVDCYISEAKRRIYCSRRCYYQSQRGQMFTRSKGGKRDDIGIFVRSAWEANYARYLNMLKTNGDILKWQYEAEIFEFKRIKRGTRSYRPDFKIWFPDGHIEYHEVKGWLMPTAQTALKRMAKYYPKVKLVIIDKDWFAAVRRQGLPALIAGWE